MLPGARTFAVILFEVLVVAGVAAAAVWFAEHDYATAAIALGMFVGFAEIFREIAEVKTMIRQQGGEDDSSAE